MDFFNMNFSTLFKNKHGDKIFGKICNMIKEENATEYSNTYIAIIFKISFLDFFGLNDVAITNLMKNTKPSYDIDIINIKKIHTKSINEIEKYLQSAIYKQ